jgi:hypothetical protein
MERNIHDGPNVFRTGDLDIKLASIDFTKYANVVISDYSQRPLRQASATYTLSAAGLKSLQAELNAIYPLPVRQQPAPLPSSNVGGEFNRDVAITPFRKNLNTTGKVGIHTGDRAGYANLVVDVRKEGGLREYVNVTLAPADVQKLRDVLNEAYPAAPAPAPAPAPVVQEPAPAVRRRKSPSGDQQYRGNGSHKWEGVTTGTDRLRVPGGWLYRFNNQAVTFVPVPDAVGYAV